MAMMLSRPRTVKEADIKTAEKVIPRFAAHPPSLFAGQHACPDNVDIKHHGDDAQQATNRQRGRHQDSRKSYPEICGSSTLALRGSARVSRQRRHKASWR